MLAIVATARLAITAAAMWPTSGRWPECSSTRRTPSVASTCSCTRPASCRSPRSRRLISRHSIASSAPTCAGPSSSISSPLGRDPRGRSDRQLLDLDHPAPDAGLWRLRRFEGRRRGPDADRAAWTGHHRQRRRARPDRDAAVLRGQGPGADRPHRVAEPDGAPGHPRGHRGGDRFLAGPGRWVNGQVLYANGGAA